MSLRRTTARVLPVDREGRVLLLHGWDPLRPADPFWFSIGGAIEHGETLREAAARELREEAGIRIDPALLGEPIGAFTADFWWGGRHFVQDMTFFAVAVRDVTVTFDGLDPLERATIDKHGWLCAEELEADLDPPADPELPGLMRAAVAMVHGPR